MFHGGWCPLWISPTTLRCRMVAECIHPLPESARGGRPGGGVLVSFHPVDFTGLGEVLLMSSETRNRLGAIRRMARREHLYNSGDFDDSIYVVQSGYLKTSTSSRDGRQCLLAIHGPGEVFGEACLVPGVRTETAIAMRDATVRRIRSADLLSAVVDDAMMERVVMCLAERMSDQQQAITNLVTMNSEQRLAATILHLARKLGRRTGMRLCLDERITQDELSALVGTTRSRIGHFLRRFHNLGYLESAHGAFLVINEQRLAAYAGV